METDGVRKRKYMEEYNKVKDVPEGSPRDRKYEIPPSCERILF